MGFTDAEINNNRALLSLFQTHCSDDVRYYDRKWYPDYLCLLKWVENKIEDHAEITNPKGYVIESIRQHTEKRMREKGLIK